MLYEEPAWIARQDALDALESARPEVVCETLVRLAFHDDDGAFVEQLCLDRLGDLNEAVRCVAVVCLGHLARLHGALSDAAIDRLHALVGDPIVGGHASDALDDVATYVTRHTSG